MSISDKDNKIIEYTRDIVSAYLSNNKADCDNIPSIISTVYKSLSECKTNDIRIGMVETSCSISDTVSEDFITCLEDGKKVKMLRPYLKRRFNMTPEEYKKKWKLPHNYPMTAPSYASLRSKLAKDIKLGRMDAD
jgi:predicted transcriptional regulator